MQYNTIPTWYENYTYGTTLSHSKFLDEVNKFYNDHVFKMTPYKKCTA